MIDLQTVPQPRDEFCERKVGVETVLLADSGVEVLSLNEVGSFIWEQIDGRRTLKEIIGNICAEYQVEAEQAESDLRAFVLEMNEHNLVTLSEDDA